MNKIDNLSDDANQLTNVTLADSSLVSFNLIYLPTIQRWSMNVSHPLLTANSLMLCVHPNILRTWKNIIPFGLMCFSNDGGDPVFVDDFSTNRIQLYILTAAEVLEVETTILEAL